jgi:hypothetical protein
MRKLFFIGAIFCLFSISALAQNKATDFSGTWTLDVSKSKLDERARIESMTMTVSQTAKDITVASKTTRTPRPEGSPGGQGGGGMGRGGFGGGGDSSMTYGLDGKETTIQQEGPNGSTPVKLKAQADGSNLHLSSSRTFNGPMGEISITSKEDWSLSADGKTLTVKRESTSPRGTNSSELVFVKK